MKHPVRHAVIAVAVVAALSAAYMQRVALRDAFAAWRAPVPPPAVGFKDVRPTPAPAGTLKPGQTALPKSVNLAVPFTSQAPLSNWDAFHEEACEEASLYMVHRFYQGETAARLDPKTVEAELKRIAAFEDKTFGFNADTTAAQTGEIAQKLYGYAKTAVLKDPTVDQIKAELAAGHPVIIPAAGQQLGNPYFTAPGPVYHMLVLRGYTPDGFISNDPGTRHGEQMAYRFDTLMSAIHDWNAEDIAKGGKVVLVVYPNP